MSYSQSSAEILRDILESGWSLSDPLEKVPVSPVSGTQYVYFFDRKQIIMNEKAKAIVVEKIVHEGDENMYIHPNEIQEADIYEITLHLRVTSVNREQFDVWLTNMDNMAAEVLRILKTVYDPTAIPPLGVFFQIRTDWINQDIYKTGSQPELRRKLIFTLTRIASPNDETYLGFGDTLTFDNTSEGDNPPASDYQYTEVYNVNISEGFETIPYLTKDLLNGAGVPYLSRGIFKGTFSAILQAKRSDFEGTTTDKLSQIYKMQEQAPLIGQHAKAVFLHSNTNTETPPATMTTKTFVKVTNVEKISDDIDLLKYRVSGSLFKPSEYIFS